MPFNRLKVSHCLRTVHRQSERDFARSKAVRNSVGADSRFRTELLFVHPILDRDKTDKGLVEINTE